MAISVREAGTRDRDLLVAMMREFYAESQFPCDPARAAAAFDRLLAEPRYGAAWILAADGEPAGYFVMTLGYSMEFGGESAVLDDLFIRAPFRGRGLGRAAMTALLAACEQRRVPVVHIEVGEDNAAARALYAKFGFAPRALVRLVRELGAPLHRAMPDERA
jgi:GNAT superfamily N-acetyltransferase